MRKYNFYNINKNLHIYKFFKESKYRSLKHENFFHIYDSLFNNFRKKKITFVEIGVANGGSLFMWKKYFSKDSSIIGIDFNPTAKKWEKYGFKIFIGNQSDPNFWKFFFTKIGKVDIILDDGGHTNQQMINTFDCCYTKVKNGGLIVFEDTHTSYLGEFGNPSKYSFINFCYSIANKINLNFFGKKFLYNYQEFIYKISFFQSIVAFYIDKKKSKKSNALDNKGIVLNAEDYRLKDSRVFLFINILRISLKNMISPIFYNQIKKIYPLFKFIFFKIKKNKKHFFY